MVSVYLSRLVSPGPGSALHWEIGCLSRLQRRWAVLLLPVTHRREDCWPSYWIEFENVNMLRINSLCSFFLYFFYLFLHFQAAEMAEQLSEALLEDLLDDTARAAWAAETDRQLEGMAQCRLQAPTLESMLLRMEEIQVRPGNKRLLWSPKGHHQQSVCYFIVSRYDSSGLRLLTDEAHCWRYVYSCVWAEGSGGSEEAICFDQLFRPSSLGSTWNHR